ncbi:MAG: hypothetical protein LUD72_07435 [Bacteroidales bacterium]|nr:hypothetical protein [Bacteroidales bacterium]
MRKIDELDLEGVDTELLEELTRNELERVRLDNELHKAKSGFADSFKAEVMQLKPQAVGDRTPLYPPVVVRKKWKYRFSDYWHNLKIVLGLEKPQPWN